MTRDEAAALALPAHVMLLLNGERVLAVAHGVVMRHPTLLAKFRDLGVPYKPHPLGYDPDDPETGAYQAVRVPDEAGGLRRMTREEIRLSRARGAEVCLVECVTFDGGRELINCTDVQIIEGAQ